MIKILFIFLLLIPLVYAQCEGCQYDDECIDVGTQKFLSKDGSTIYCSEDKRIEITKIEGELCQFNYECESFFCDNECKTFETKKEFNLNFLPYTFIMIFIFLLIALIFNTVKKRKKVKINNAVNKPTKVLIKNIKRKSPDDELESNIKNSMRGLSDIFRRK